MEQGSIIEQGSPSSLIEDKNSKFFELYDKCGKE